MAAAIPPGALTLDPPVGTIVAFAGKARTVDEEHGNWLVCDGRPLDRTNYPILFGAIGTAWGGDGAPTFYLPDLRGQFLRGVDRSGDGSTRVVHDPDRDDRVAYRPPGTGVAPGNAGNDVGSFQNDELRSHVHRVADPGHTHEVKRGFLAVGHGGYAQAGSGDGGSDVHDWSDRRFTEAGRTGIQLIASGGSETRPANAYVYWIIRYR